MSIHNPPLCLLHGASLEAVLTSSSPAPLLQSNTGCASLRVPCPLTLFALQGLRWPHSMLLACSQAYKGVSLPAAN